MEARCTVGVAGGWYGKLKRKFEDFEGDGNWSRQDQLSSFFPFFGNKSQKDTGKNPSRKEAIFFQTCTPGGQAWNFERLEVGCRLKERKRSTRFLFRHTPSAIVLLLLVGSLLWVPWYRAWVATNEREGPLQAVWLFRFLEFHSHDPSLFTRAILRGIVAQAKLANHTTRGNEFKGQRGLRVKLRA